jgi:hypothetical protein
VYDSFAKPIAGIDRAPNRTVERITKPMWTMLHFACCDVRSLPGVDQRWFVGKAHDTGMPETAASDQT